MPAPKRRMMTSSGIGIRLSAKMLKLKASASLANIYKGDKPNNMHISFNLQYPYYVILSIMVQFCRVKGLIRALFEELQKSYKILLDVKKYFFVYITSSYLKLCIIARYNI